MPESKPQLEIRSLNVNSGGDEYVEADEAIMRARGKMPFAIAAVCAGGLVCGLGIMLTVADNRARPAYEASDWDPEPELKTSIAPSPSKSPSPSLSPSPTPSPNTEKPTPMPTPSPSVSVIVAKPSPSPSITSAKPKPEPSPSEKPDTCTWPSIGGNQYQVGNCGNRTAYDEPGKGPFQLTEGMPFEASCVTGRFIMISIANSDDYLPKNPSYFDISKLPTC